MQKKLVSKDMTCSVVRNVIDLEGLRHVHNILKLEQS